MAKLNSGLLLSTAGKCLSRKQYFLLLFSLFSYWSLFMREGDGMGERHSELERERERERESCPFSALLILHWNWLSNTVLFASRCHFSFLFFFSCTIWSFDVLNQHNCIPCKFPYLVNLCLLSIFGSNLCTKELNTFMMYICPPLIFF